MHYMQPNTKASDHVIVAVIVIVVVVVFIVVIIVVDIFVVVFVVVHHRGIPSSWSIKYGLPLPLVLFDRISTPVSMTIIVCSNCADRFPSRVTAVQSSGHV